MKGKIWKSKAYSNTKVDYVKSQMQINKLLRENGIEDSQHSNIQGKAQLIFIKELEVERKKMKDLTFEQLEELNKLDTYPLANPEEEIVLVRC